MESSRQDTGVAIPFSMGSPQPRDQALVSCIASRFFTAELSGKPLMLSRVTVSPHPRSPLRTAGSDSIFVCLYLLGLEQTEKPADLLRQQFAIKCKKW